MKKNHFKHGGNPLKKTTKKINTCKASIADLMKKIKNASALKYRIEKANKAMEEMEGSWKGELIGLTSENSLYHISRRNIEDHKRQLSLIDIQDLKIRLSMEQKTLSVLNAKLKDVRPKVAVVKPTINHPPNKTNSSSVDQSTSKIPRFTPRAAPPLISTKSVVPRIIKPDWNDVNFFDGYITALYRGERYRMSVRQSKQFINHIKSHYVFKNVPQLEMEVSGTQINRIINEYVLFYHIEYFSTLGADFGFIEYQQNHISQWGKYTKDFYQRHLPFLFHSESLRKLCELCDDNLPIIPAAEVLINESGGTAIHNSFLFPIKSKKSVKVIWESIEESKASYVFDVRGGDLSSIQLLYDYIVGETVNKRESLIHSKELQNKLGMRGRIFHTTFAEWKGNLRLIAL